MPSPLQQVTSPMCSNTCVFLAVLGLEVESTDVSKATLEVYEPWSGIKRYSDSDGLAYPVQKSVRKQTRRKTWGNGDNGHQRPLTSNPPH